MSIEGQVQVQGSDQSSWRPGKLEEQLCKGDSIRVGKLGRAAVVLANEGVMRLDQNTTIRLLDISGKKEQRSFVELVKGALQSFSRKPRLLSVNTPYLNGSIEGTEFETRVEDDRASILVLEGRVAASNDRGTVALMPGDKGESTAGDAPTARTLVKPRDAVQWSLHYPSILATGGATPDAGQDGASPLDQAARLLAVGRQDEALAAIDAVLRQDPQSGLAHALRAIIHIARNERTQALASAEKAVSLNDTTATRIALSYAQQADFRIAAARDTLLAAVDKNPDAPLAWARLSELRLMLGDKDGAGEAAAKAVALAPDLARTQLVLGFAALADYRTDDARTAFRRSIELDSSDPLAHLGLGLARIGGGELQDGRSELEVAVALDPNQALLRAYLGKAYFEERRSALDDQQFGIAKSLDPFDPTAFLYDGIRKQTENRPVEALEDLEKSSTLNDARAVYRSRLLLDKDQAARGTSVARVYSDLGFAELGAIEASRSLAIDP
ncbi:MAG TPA: FecR domain-containing protein, partial [Methyloversatilis sp.]